MTTTSTPTRTAPLEAPVAPIDPSIAGAPAAHADAAADRDRRFLEGVRQLRVGSASLKLDERLLLVVGGVLAPLGLLVVLLGWWGASHTGYVFEQVPYLISGGLLGVALVVLGAFCYFAHWLTVLVKEQRAQSAAIIDALSRLEERMAGTPTVSAAAPAHRNGSAPAATDLVATERGSMAHRPDCVVVAGKSGLRTVRKADGLTPCKLCEPFPA